MKVLSLCDGMSCGLLAFKKLGIDVEYYAVELDKFPRLLSDSNLPEIIRPCNDVYELDEEKLDSIGVVDWVIFGFACQAFSVAGKQGGLQSDPLLLQCMKVLHYCQKKNPNLKYLIENVKMKKSLLEEVDAVIQAPYRTLINSALLSAQNRERYYWTNFPVSQPSDSGLVIADILEDQDFFSEREKSFCLDASYHKGASADEYLTKSRRQLVFKYSESNRYTKSDGTPTQKASEAAQREVERRMIPGDKSLTLTTGDGCGSGMKAINLVGLARGFNRGYSRPVGSSKAPALGSSSWEQNNHLQLNNRKSQTILSTIHKENEKPMLKRGKMGLFVQQVNTDKSCGGKQPKMQDRIYSPYGKSVALTSFASRTNVGESELSYRKLTVRECARLQTIPEWYSFDAVSKTQAYKAIGNSWTMEVIAHIISESMKDLQ